VGRPVAVAPGLHRLERASTFGGKEPASGLTRCAKWRTTLCIDCRDCRPTCPPGRSGR